MFYHNKQSISRSVGNANKCSVSPKPLRETKGDLKGKEFPLDYLVRKIEKLKVRPRGGEEKRSRG